MKNYHLHLRGFVGDYGLTKPAEPFFRHVADSINDGPTISNVFRRKTILTI